MHKTAYDVRISDWSSDACSSDLADAVDADAECSALRHGIASIDRKIQQRELELIWIDLDEGHLIRGLHLHRDIGPERDRKSVVAGQSVFVRVDLDGGRLIKQKKKAIEDNKYNTNESQKNI